MTNYWVVGATVQGNEMADHFIRGGLWFGDAEGAQESIERIQIGDRLIIKKGFAVSRIEIKAIGVVKESKKFDTDSLRLRVVFVDWLDMRSLNKTVSSHGAFRTIQGPYDQDHSLIKEVISIL